MGDFCSASSAVAMAALWEDVLRNEAAVEEAARVAVDAALLQGVLMRTEGEPNASDVSAGAESRDAFGAGRGVSQQSERSTGRSRLPSLGQRAALSSERPAARLKHSRPGGL